MWFWNKSFVIECKVTICAHSAHDDWWLMAELTQTQKIDDDEWMTETAHWQMLCGKSNYIVHCTLNRQCQQNEDEHRVRHMMDEDEHSVRFFFCVRRIQNQHPDFWVSCAQEASIYVLRTHTIQCRLIYLESIFIFVSRLATFPLIPLMTQHFSFHSIGIFRRIRYEWKALRRRKKQSPRMWFFIHW